MFNDNDLLMTLNDYLILPEGDDLMVLDAMCGVIPYWPVFYSFIESKVSLIVGIDMDVNSANALVVLNKYYPKSELITGDVLSESRSFDLITTFRPNCGYPGVEKLIPVYTHLNSILSPGGKFFGTTYWNNELINLIKLLEISGFNDIVYSRNEHDLFEVEHGWVITASKGLLIN